MPNSENEVLEVGGPANPEDSRGSHSSGSYELPFIGGLFQIHKSKSAALSSVAKSVCECAAGGFAMAFTPLEPEESMEVKWLKLALAMKVGTAAGGMAYNTAVGCTRKGITTLYKCCLKRAADRRREELGAEIKPGFNLSLPSS
jgi:hypothetical protein